jgi:chromosome segregation protein
MNENINIVPSKAYNLKNTSKMKYRPYSSKISEKRNMVRVLSAGNINDSNYSKNLNIYKNYYILPSLNNNNSSVIIKRKKKNNSMYSKGNRNKNQYKIELEKLYDQNVYYKKTIKQLQSEIKELKIESIDKQNILNSMNQEIENLINEGKNKASSIITENVPFSDQGKYSLIKKMRNQIKETELGLNNEILKNKNLKKNLKYTRHKELELEKKIFDEQKEKISLLIDNSMELKNKQDKELMKSKLLDTNIQTQKNIIYNFEQKYKKLKDEEILLQNEIIKYENILNQTNNKVKIIKLKQISLKEKNNILNKEKKEFMDKNKDKNYSLEELKQKLSKTKNEYYYYKLKNQKTTEKLNSIKKNYNFSLEQYKRMEDNIPKIQEEEFEKHKINNMG